MLSKSSTIAVTSIDAKSPCKHNKNAPHSIYSDSHTSQNKQKNIVQSYGETVSQYPLPVSVSSIHVLICIFVIVAFYICIYIYTGAGHIIRISSKSWIISVIPFKKWNLYNVYIHSTQTDIFQVFISFNFDDYKWKLMKTPNSVSQKIRILWKGSILKTPGATL